MPSKHKPETIKKILIMDLGGIGDLVMGTPSLRALRRHFPESQISLLTVPRSAQVVASLPYFDQLFCIDMTRFRNIKRAIFSPAFLKNLLLLWQLRRAKFDMMVDMICVESDAAAQRRAMFFKIINPKLAVGRDTDGRGFYLDHKVPEAFLGQMPEPERKLQIVESLGVEVTDRRMEFPISAKDRAAIETFLTKHNVSADQPLIGINPGSFLPTRRWPKDRFVKLAQLSAQELGAKVVVTGGKSEIELVDEIGTQLQATDAILATELSLGQLAALLERLTLLVTNDTGPMHIAAALNTPTVAIFGPENYFRFAPYGESLTSLVIAIDDIPCRPCTHFHCPTQHECMAPISVERVWQAVETVVAQLPESVHQ